MTLVSATNIRVQVRGRFSSHSAWLSRKLALFLASDQLQLAVFCCSSGRSLVSSESPDTCTISRGSSLRSVDFCYWLAELSSLVSLAQVSVVNRYLLLEYCACSRASVGSATYRSMARAVWQRENLKRSETMAAQSIRRTTPVPKSTNPILVTRNRILCFSFMSVDILLEVYRLWYDSGRLGDPV